METKIEKVEIEPGKKFIVNESVIIYNLDVGDDGITYSINWDEDLIDEKQAFKLADQFMQDTINGIKNK